MAQTDGRQSQKEAVQCGAAALKKGKKKVGWWVERAHLMPGAHWRIFQMEAGFNNAGDRRYADEFKPISII